MRRILPWLLIVGFVTLAVLGLVFGSLTPIYQKAKYT